MTLPNNRVLVIGISGATCSGKTTIAKELNKILPDCRAFCQDDYYRPVDDPKHTWIPELKHINWDIVSSLDMEKMTRDLQEHIELETSKATVIEARPKEQRQVSFGAEKLECLHKIKESKCHIVIVEGFCIFNYGPLVDMCDLKYYFTLDYDECRKRRIKRVYEPPDVPGYFENCVWPEHIKQLSEVRRNVHGVVYFDGNSTNHSELILKDIVKLLQ